MHANSPSRLGRLRRSLSRRLTDLTYRFQLFRLARVAGVLLVIWVSGAVVLLLFERGHHGPNALDTFPRALWGIAVYLLSGYEEYIPATPGGRVVSAAVMMCGVLAVSYLTAVVAAVLVEHAIRRMLLPRKPERARLEDHIVICGWRSGPGRIVIRELMALLSPEPPTVVILSEQAGQITRLECPYPGCYTVEGSPVLDEALLRADLPRARAAVVIDEGDAPGDPTFAILAGLAVESLAEPVHTIALAADQRSAGLLRRAGIDEVIEYDTFGHSLIAQSALQPGLSRLFGDLLTTDAQTNEVYQVALPARWHGRSYAALVDALAALPVDLIPLGLRPHRGPLTVNPRSRPTQNRPGRDHRLGPDDVVLLLAHARPDLEELLG